MRYSSTAVQIPNKIPSTTFIYRHFPHRIETLIIGHVDTVMFIDRECDHQV